MSIHESITSYGNGKSVYEKRNTYDLTLTKFRDVIPHGPGRFFYLNCVPLNGPWYLL